MITAPVEFLLHGALEDRAIHRTLVLYGPMTGPELARRMGGPRQSYHSRLSRLARLRLVSCRRVAISRQHSALEWRALSHTEAPGRVRAWLRTHTRGRR
jgi:hypothetical protein